MIENQTAAPADYLRFLANSDLALQFGLTIEQIQTTLRPLYPWIFDHTISSASIDDFFDFTGSKIIGEGAQGSIKTAINKSDGSKVACKFFKRQPTGTLPPDDLGPSWSSEGAFLRELRIFEFLPKEPGFPKLLGAYLTTEEMVLALSLHGTSLESLYLQKPLPFEQIKAYAKEIFYLINRLIKNGIWHCDPRLANILLPPEGEAGRLTIVDFGGSTTSNEKFEVMLYPWTTTHYPPEAHFDNSLIPEKAMVWTLGDDVYRMMTQLPLTIDGTHRTVEQQKELFAKEYQINPDWPEEVRIFLKAVLTEETTRPSLEQLHNFDFLK